MDSDHHTVHYVTQDAMPNLKLRVTLTLLSSARFRAPTSNPHETGDGTQQQPTTEQLQGPATESSPATSATGPQQAFKAVRIFGWQEKVYSKSELVAAQAQLQSNKQKGRQGSSPRRAAHFGSQTRIGADKLQRFSPDKHRCYEPLMAPPLSNCRRRHYIKSASPEGSILFSYVQTDEFCERFEASRCITTSKWERHNHLAHKLATDARNRQKMLNFQSMCIMADLGNETTVAGSNEMVLCVLRAHHDGSFDMTPGFSTPAKHYRFEDDHGGIYEYTLELASQTIAPSLEKHTAKLVGAVAAQAEALRRQNIQDQLPSPGPDANALRLLLLAELVSAAGFERDRLYIEWQLHFDPELWILQHIEQEVVQPGLIQGVTHVSQMVQYPEDPSTDTPPVWVAHFAHPIEVEWIAQAPPQPKHWPRLLLQICTYDLWDRMTTEGYGWMQLGPMTTSGSSTHYVDTWKPQGSRRDQQQAYFIGGSEELQDPTYMAVPKGHKGSVLNKYGYKTQTSGNVKVRIHAVLQSGAAGSTSPSKAAAKRTTAASSARSRGPLSLAVVLERARSRLQEARGGEVIVRDGLLVQPPSLTLQPQDAVVNEGATVQLRVSAVGIPPLRYQWFRDSKRLTMATSNTPLLVLVEVQASDSGVYHCQVSNKDGSVSSSKALVTVNRMGRLHASTAPTPARSPDPPPGSSGTVQGASMTSSLGTRTTVPRTIPVAGSPSLPFSLRLGNAAAAESTQAAGTGRAKALSPLRTSAAFGSQPPATAGEAAARAGLSGLAPPSSSPGIKIPVRRFAASSRPQTRPGGAGGVSEEAAAPGAAESLGPQGSKVPTPMSAAAEEVGRGASGTEVTTQDSSQHVSATEACPVAESCPEADHTAAAALVKSQTLQGLSSGSPGVAGSPARRTRVSDQGQ